MLGLRDALELAPGVRLVGGVLADEVRGSAYPANATARFVLDRAGTRLDDVANELARRYDLDPEQARCDVLRFAYALNRAELANIVPGEGRTGRLVGWARLAVRLAPAGVLPPPVGRRVALDTSNWLRGAVTAARALLRRAAVLAAAAVVLAAPGGVTPGILALGIGVGAGVVVHEAGHAALLAGIGAALVVSGLRVSVVHRPLPGRRRRVVAAAGPVAAAALGALLVGVAWLASAPELALAGCAPAAHAIGLTVAAGDGRAACGL